MADDGRYRGGCDEALGRLGAFVALDLDAAGEARVRDHLAGCAACRAALLALDPSALFLDLRREPLPERFWDGFQESLRSRFEAAPPRPRWADLFRYPRLAYLTAPLAMVLVLGATLLVVRPGRPGIGGRVGQDGIRSPYAPPAGAPRSGPVGAAGTGGEPAAGAVRLGAGSPLEDPAAGLPAIEEVGSPGARVYRFTVGGEGDETSIYLVVDENIDF
jgi:hypothetical protein